MPLIALALTSASGLHAALYTANPGDKPEIRVERRVVIEHDDSTPGLMQLLGTSGGSIDIDVQVHSDDGEGADINTLHSRLNHAEGGVKIVVIGPDGHQQVIERDLKGVGALLEHVDLRGLLEGIELDALVEQHGDQGHDGDRRRGTQDRNNWRTHDASQGDNGHRRHTVEQDRTHRAREAHDAMVQRMHRVQREMEERVRRTHDGMRDRTEQRRLDQGHDADRRDHPHEGHSDRRGNQHRDPQGDMDMALMRQQLMARDGHDMDPEIREHVMEMMRQGFHMPEGMNPLDAHRRNDGHGEGHGDMDMRHMHRQMMAEQDERDDDPERFFRASESFIEQLQHAKAVAGQLDNDAAVALLAIWYASEHMEPEQCLDLMVSVMNDDSILPKVRRAAAFTGVQKAGELGNDQLAQRILGAIIRGAGMTESARMRRNDDARQTDRRPDRVTDRAPRPEHDDAPIQQRRDRR